MKNIYNVSPLKWAGSKAKVLPILIPVLEKYKVRNFAEPFMGALNVSLNFDAERYYLNDANSDLVDCFSGMVDEPEEFIEQLEVLFEMEGYDGYVEIKNMFNSMDRETKRELPELFLYLNKHCFNGLCRYNSKGEFNVSVGSSKSPPKLPRNEIRTVANKFSNGSAIFSCMDYHNFIQSVSENVDDCLLYLDPPFVPLTSNFKYNSNDFTPHDHEILADLAMESKHTTIISNHYTEFTAELYKHATEIIVFDVQRTISCDGGERKKVKECIAIFEK